MAFHSVSTDRAEPSLGASLGRAIDLAQRVAIDQLRLLQLESHERVESVARRTAWVGAGVFCLLVAWIGLLCALVVALEDRLPLDARLALVAGSQLVLGLALIGAGLRARGERRP